MSVRAAPPAAPDDRSGRRRRPSALAAALGLDVLAVVLAVCIPSLVEAPRPGEPVDTAFFSDPLPAIVVLLAVAAAVGGGVVALVSLRRAPLRSRAGRWAVRLAVVFAGFVPVMALVVMGIAWIAGLDLPEGWGQPTVPVWMLTALASIVLGFAAPEPGRRGALMLPLIVGAFVVTFALGEVLVPH